MNSKNRYQENNLILKWDTDLNRLFERGNINGQEILNNMFNIISQRQIKTTLGFHLTPVRMTKMNKTNTSCSQGYRVREPLLHCWYSYYRDECGVTSETCK